MTFGEQKSIRSGQPEASTNEDALVVLSTEVGESGGEACRLRPSMDRRRPALGERRRTGLRPRAPAAARIAAAGTGASTCCSTSWVAAALLEPEPRSSNCGTASRSSMPRPPRRRWPSRPPWSRPWSWSRAPSLGAHDGLRRTPTPHPLMLLESSRPRRPRSSRRRRSSSSSRSSLGVAAGWQMRSHSAWSHPASLLNAASITSFVARISPSNHATRVLEASTSASCCTTGGTWSTADITAGRDP